MLPTHERAHTHVRTRPRKMTYSSKQALYSIQQTEAQAQAHQSRRRARHPPEHSRGGGIPAVEAAGIPVVEVHEGAKRPGMRIIPDSPENTTHQSKSLPHSAAHTSQPRRRLRGRRPRATLTPSTCMQRAAPSIACGSGNTLGESCCRTWRRLRAKYGRRPQTTTSAMDATLRVEQAPLAQ